MCVCVHRCTVYIVHCTLYTYTNRFHTSPPCILHYKDIQEAYLCNVCSNLVQRCSLASHNHLGNNSIVYY